MIDVVVSYHIVVPAATELGREADELEDVTERENVGASLRSGTSTPRPLILVVLWL